MKDKITVEMIDGTLWDIEDDDDLFETIETFMGSEMSDVVNRYVDERVAEAIAGCKDRDTEAALRLTIEENDELRTLLSELCGDFETLREMMRQGSLSRKWLKVWADRLYNKICDSIHQ